MNKNKKLIKPIAVAMTGVMLAGQTGAAVLAADKAVNKTASVQSEKEETVYVKAEPDGAVSDIIVSNWLKNPEGSDTLEDTSDLSDIENVKGEETFTREGDKITWTANGNDIYYQGKTTRELPVSVEITYYLDGKKIEPQELAGKSGHVKIAFDYKNKMKKGDVYTPFLMATGLILPEENFHNVEVTNGKLVADGEKNIVIGIGLPGMNDSLKMKDSELMKELDIDFPESFEIEADVTDFELTMSMTVASNLDLSDLDLDEVKDREELQDKIDEMKDGATQLVDGTGELADGVQELKDSCQELIDGMNSLDEGAGTLNDGLTTLNTKKNDLVSGINALVSGIDTLNSKKGELISGVDQLANGIYTLNNNKGTLINGINELANGAGALDEGAAALKDGTSQLADGAGALDSNKDQLIAGVDQLAAGINGDGTANNPGLLKGAKELAAGLDMLAESVNGSNNGDSLSNGVAKLKAGVANLMEAVDGQALPGIAQLEGGIDRLLAAIGDSKTPGTLKGGVQALKDAVGQLQQQTGSLGTGLQQMKAGIDGVNTDVLDPVITGINNSLTSGTGGSGQDTGATTSEMQMAAVDVEVNPAEAAPDAVASLQASLEANRSVLSSLQGVKGTVGAVKLPDSMKALSGTYDSYVGELDSCISQLESAIASQEAALAALQTTQIQTVEAEVPVDVNQSQGGERSANGDTVEVSTVDLQTWKGTLESGKKVLQDISTEIGSLMGQLQGDGSAQNPGLSGALNQMSTGLDQLAVGLDGVKSGLSSGSTSAPGLKEGIATLKAGISSGSQQQPGVKEGLQQILTGLEQLAAGIDVSLADGISKLQAGSKTLAGGVQQMANGINSTYDKNGAMTKMGLKDGMHALGDGIGQVASGANDLKSGAGELKEGAGKLSAGTTVLQNGAGTLADGVGQLASGAGKLQSGAATLGSGVQQLANGGSQLKDGGVTLADGIEQLASGGQELKEGTSKLADGGTQLDEGVDKLNDGAMELRDGMEEFNEEAIEKITDVLENDLQEFIDRLDDIKEAGEEYQSFSESGNTSGNVKFIIETGSIELE